MLRSLYTGISGMRSMQTMMDVTGNNIANVNTTGFKSANTIFEDTLSQTLTNGSAPQGAKAGTNPAQVGLGVRVAGLTSNWSQGAVQTTGRNSDMLVDGDGFFVVKNNGVNQYTRAGAFNLDANGTLSSLGGGKLQGWMAAGDGTVNTAGNLETIVIPTTKTMPAYATQNVSLSGRLDNTIETTTPTGTTAAASATQTFTYSVVDRNGVDVPLNVTIQPTTVTNTGSSTGLATAWTMTVKQGNTVVGKMSYTPTATPQFATVALAAGETGAAGTTSATGKLTTSGVKGADGNDFDTAAGVTPVVNEPTFDFTGVVVANRTDNVVSDVGVKTQDGYRAGGLTGWKVEQDGAVIGTFDNGRSMQLARVAVATFDNPSGLEKMGSSMFLATSNSGLANIGPAGDGAHGAITAGALEMSNVDLAQEFTNLIVSQRGFQANSRVITTSDTMLEELVNLKR